MKININIECESKEIAALASSLQERHSQPKETDVEEISHQIYSAIRNGFAEFYENIGKKEDA